MVRVMLGAQMEEVKKKHAGGRPPIYQQSFAEQAKKLCLLGATDESIANFFGVSVSCVDKWKVAHPEFLQSLRDGKEIADAKVAESLFNRACGYVTKEAKIASTDGKITDVVEVDKYYPPDSTAAIFWLKNRQSKLWRDKQEIEHSGSISELSDEKLEEEIKKRMAELDAK